MNPGRIQLSRHIPQARALPGLLALAFLVALTSSAAGAGFTDIGAALADVDGPSVAWGDYDNDGDLDILLAGRAVTAPGTPHIARVYRSSGGPSPTFTEAVEVPGTDGGSAAWGDYDNDGYLDILVTGALDEGCGVVWVHHNNGGADPTFSYVSAGIIGVYEGSVAWGDYDNDGDLDVLLTGVVSTSPFLPIARVYRNEGGASPAFVDTAAGLPGVQRGSGAWGDYDNDGDLDILLTGTGSTGLYRNSGGVGPTFSAAFAGLSDLGMGSSGSFGDYDGDGDLDVLLTGEDGSSNDLADVYRASGGFYMHIQSLTGGGDGSGAWGDYDNDGDLDVLFVGHNPSAGSLAIVYRNEGGGFPDFNDIGAGLPGVGNGSRGAAAWGDYDNDGDLDILLAGNSTQSPFVLARVYRNDSATANTPPTAPTNLSVSMAGTRATFSWSAATDAQTPAAGLSYNLRVGTSPGAGDILAPMADAATGTRRLPALGNANLRTSREIELPSAGSYYWSVQAVDGAFAGSPFPADEITGATGIAVPDDSAAEVRWSRGPNPFSNATTFRFSQPARGPVLLRIYDVSGRRVRSLDDGELPAGHFTRTWDGRNDAGRPLPAGVYFARLETSALVKSEKITLVR